MNLIRLKANLEMKSIEDRLQYNPSIIEFFLSADDLKNPALIRERIRLVKQKGCRVYLHHPPKYAGRFLDIMSTDPVMERFYLDSSNQLAEICQSEEVRCVIHGNYSGTESCGRVDRELTVRMRDKIAAIESFAHGYFLWEDSIEGLFSYANPHLIDEVIVPLRLPVNVDVSHTFIAFKGDNDKLEDVLKRTKPYAQYYHLVDSMGQSHDALPLGQGRINWQMVKPYVADSDFIFEIGLSGDHTDCTPMVESAQYFEQV
ncbi:sugar phosphate isomerase/epimerase [Paenibacillus sambharensis]|uniref:Sugar phosphate isomerase/epimerase n=1 Tax=Paenibacillus sambharensis TaxID=1803190 RepID=A0A2W1LRH8_9BACL|nr:TIM barrel protein [Paenibacillus sambharensis]PZD94431.1 sugar phosphate isomerase/epimerase [Paenibacillus sambharensis]